MFSLDADSRFSLTLQQTKPNPGPERRARSCEDCSHRAGSQSFHALLPIQLRSRDTWTPQMFISICFRKGFDQAWLQPVALTLQGCVLWEPFQNRALWQARCSWARCPRHPNPPACAASQEPMVAQVGPFETLLRSQTMHPSKVTVSKPVSSRKAGHWHKQFLKFLFWLELVSALLCKRRSKGIKRSRWGNLESPTLHVAAGKGKHFVLKTKSSYTSNQFSKAE